MARTPHMHLPGGLYHIMLRGTGGQPIFFGDDDCQSLETLVAEGDRRFGHRIYGYCWITNHVHLAMQVQHTLLAQTMQSLAFCYTRWLNKRQGHTGHVFQERYKAILVDAEAYLLQLIRYIHLNPVHAGVVQEPSAYPWSGHQAYLGRHAWGGYRSSPK